LTCLIGLVIAPILGGHDNNVKVEEVTETEFVQAIQAEASQPAVQTSKEVRIESMKDADGKVKTTVTTTTNDKVDTQVFEGTEAEVNAKLDAFRKQ